MVWSKIWRDYSDVYFPSLHYIQHIIGKIANLCSARYIFSCGTVALMVLCQFSDICGPYGYGFHPIKDFRNCAVKKLGCFFAHFCYDIVCENSQTYIFRFVRYTCISTFFYAYLPINIHFQLVIITNVLILPQWQDGGTK